MAARLGCIEACPLLRLGSVQMAHPVLLGPYIVLGQRAYSLKVRLTGRQKTGISNTLQLVGVIGHQSNTFVSDIVEHVGRNFVVPCIGRKIECKVCIECVESTVLEIVGLHFGKEADTSTFLSEV